MFTSDNQLAVHNGNVNARERVRVATRKRRMMQAGGDCPESWLPGCVSVCVCGDSVITDQEVYFFASCPHTLLSVSRHTKGPRK